MQNNRRRQIFPCRSEQCQYSSRDFNKTLNHVWDKHGLMAEFSYGVFLIVHRNTEISKVIEGMYEIDTLGFTIFIFGVMIKTI